MSTKPAKTPGAPAASRRDRTRTSPLGPTGGGSSGLPFDDVSVKDFSHESVRPRRAGEATGSDAPLGTKGNRVRRATTAGAQYRITQALPAPELPEARATLANGRLMRPVMGQRGSFAAGQADY